MCVTINTVQERPMQPFSGLKNTKQIRKGKEIETLRCMRSVEMNM